MYEGVEFVDDISGLHLDKAMAMAARKVEMQFFQKMNVYTKVRREPWMRPISTKWIDCNKRNETD